MENLNKSQFEAVTHISGPCMVLAGPGSGKTRVISYRINYMVNNVNINPSNILAISFTRASAKEMKKRTCSLDPSGRVQNVTFGTFHSIFFRIIKFANKGRMDIKNILMENQKFLIMKKLFKNVTVRGYEVQDGESPLGADDINTLLEEFSYVINEMIEPEEYVTGIAGNRFHYFFEEYNRYKKEIGMMDFDDMLINAYYALKNNAYVLEYVKNRYRYILIDEFQDINKVQFEIVRLIIGNEKNLFVVGDEDQSIYGFRGSRPDYLLEFSKYFPDAKRVIMNINYRSTPNIVEVGNRLIVHNEKRYDKFIEASKTDNGNTKVIFPESSSDEVSVISNMIMEGFAKGRKYSDFAILYRQNKQARPFINEFVARKIPFILKDNAGSIYSHWVVKDMISYLKIAYDKGTIDDYFNIVNKPNRYISRKLIEEAYRSGSFFDFMLDYEDFKGSQGENMDDMFHDIAMIRKKPVGEAVKYIRETVDYDSYLEELAYYRKYDLENLKANLDEFSEIANRFSTYDDFMAHIEKMKDVKASVKNETRVSEGVTLTTMHSSKGLEYNNVFIIGCNDGVIPYERRGTINDIEEERRLMYVAVTRAKENLILSAPKFKGRDKLINSRFVGNIAEIHPKLKNLKK